MEMCGILWGKHDALSCYQHFHLQDEGVGAWEGHSYDHILSDSFPWGFSSWVSIVIIEVSSTEAEDSTRDYFETVNVTSRTLMYSFIYPASMHWINAEGKH